MMTSVVMSSQPAGSLYIQTQERSDVVEEEIQSQATVHQQIIVGKSSRKLFMTNDWTISCKHIVTTSWTSRRKQFSSSRKLYASSRKLYASSRKICISSRHGIRRKKSKSSEAWQPGAKYPVDKETAVARSVVTKNKQQLSEQLLNNLLENIQPFNAINDQDGKNQWLK
ncbi:hypothetical protein F511_32350 [Dorcoceras hygrometricum]|uniref:Uncharacterized protein n=1 Tax=Dorcoceras hygrometricum TaxID=472368 RepID=A0A2Z7AVT2_9LAMI|nr:hypothetical protein F511_32350 [Dorcoceras hygrometricum]